jgi:hypothetical protein
MNEREKNPACLALEQDLVLFHYGELSGPERHRVQAHLSGCAVCTRALRELESLLPKTILSDQPPLDFWRGYSRELRDKLAAVAERQPWWRSLFTAPRSWLLPAGAASAVVALALGFTVSGDFWQQPAPAPAADDALLEILPMAENLDFFRNLDVLDELDFLDQYVDPGAV